MHQFQGKSPKNRACIRYTEINPYHIFCLFDPLTILNLTGKIEEVPPTSCGFIGINLGKLQYFLPRLPRCLNSPMELAPRLVSSNSENSTWPR